jgi:chromosome segregation ATPase
LPSVLRAEVVLIDEQFKQSLQTAQCTLDYERSSRIVEVVERDEDIRNLKCRILLLEDENESLDDQLAAEEEKADALQQRLDTAEATADDLDAEVQRITSELRVTSRELENATVRTVLSDWRWSDSNCRRNSRRWKV